MRTALRKPPRSAVATALFTPVQQRVLGLLFGQPERRFQSAELIRLAGSGTGAVHRQLQRLAATGLVRVTRDGNQKYYQAQRESPVFTELHGLIVKTVGVVEPLRAALAPLASRIHLAFVFGSVAQSTRARRQRHRPPRRHRRSRLRRHLCGARTGRKESRPNDQSHRLHVRRMEAQASPERFVRGANHHATTALRDRKR
jgi:hypothetical protein